MLRALRLRPWNSSTPGSSNRPNISHRLTAIEWEIKATGLAPSLFHSIYFTSQGLEKRGSPDNRFRQQLSLAATIKIPAVCKCAWPFGVHIPFNSTFILMIFTIRGDIPPLEWVSKNVLQPEIFPGYWNTRTFLGSIIAFIQRYFSESRISFNALEY